MTKGLAEVGQPATAMKDSQLTLLIFSVLISLCFGGTLLDIPPSSEELHLGKRFREVLRKRFNKEDEGIPPILADVFGEVLKLLAADMFPTAFSENVSEQCRNDSRTYLMSHITAQLTFNPELLWALQSKLTSFLLDSSRTLK